MNRRDIVQEGIYRDIDTERVNQQVLHGRHTCAGTIETGLKLAILTEETGEVARCLCEAAAPRGLLTSDLEFEVRRIAERAHLRSELIQVAAVAIAWVEAIDALEAGVR